MNLNKATLIGRVTKQPEERALPNGNKITTFGIATNEKYKKDNDEYVEETTFHNITSFGKLAETIAVYVKKGQEVYVEGKIKNRSWEKKDGTKAYRSDIIINKIEFGQKPKTNDDEEKEEEEEKPEEEINMDDIPY